MFLDTSIDEKLLEPSKLKNYQRECILHLLYNKNAMLWLQMGLGKTIIALTSIVDLMRAKEVSKTIIFGPIRVIESVWVKESEKWSHTKHLKFSIIRGNPKKRKESLFNDSDIYLINYEQMNWLSKTLSENYDSKTFPFQCVIYDEISKMKKSTSLRLKGGTRFKKDLDGNEYPVKFEGWIKQIYKFKYRYGLTGTPSPNGYIDLHGQFLSIDNGERLFKTVTEYRNTYFKPKHNGWGYELASKYHQQCIESKISPITKKMDSKDYLDMPSLKVIDIEVTLPDEARKHYEELEKEFFTEFFSGSFIEIENKITERIKCLQISNGAVYINNETKEWEKVHDEKLKILEEVMEEAAGSPVLCAYIYRSDAERIMKHFKKYNPINLTNEKSKKTSSIIQKWNSGGIKLLIGHPASMGHGIDGLQKSGSIVVWFGLTDSSENYEQMNGRIYRQGQNKTVSIIRILSKNTLDYAVLNNLNNKNKTQNGLKEAIEAYYLKKFKS